MTPPTFVECTTSGAETVDPLELIRRLYKEWTMHITPATHSPAAVPPGRLAPANVSASALKAANSDGDGKTGAAALNDGDAAAQAAGRQAVNVKA
jgi:hypothetical protein